MNKPLPPEVALKARLMLLDTVGCMLAARSAPEVLQLEATLARVERGSFCFPGGKPLSLLGAAAVGAMSATWDEACEGLALAHGRPGVPVVAALLPYAVMNGMTLGALVKSVVTGYEAGARAGAWLRIKPGMHVDGNWPALGVAAAMGDALDLSDEVRKTALDIVACQLPTSLYLPVASGATARNTYLPHSAWLGILAATSADAGVSAPHDALPHYAERFSAAGAQEVIPDDRFLILDAYFKPHAAVRHVHYGAEAARVIRARLKSGTRSIIAIRLRIYREAITYCGNRDPRTPIQGQFSLSFGIAAALLHGGIEANVYRPESFNEAELRRLEALVTVEVDEALTAASKRGATLTVEAGGETFEQRVDAITGDPESPMAKEDVFAKFVRYASPCVGRQRAERFADELLAAQPDVKVSGLWDSLSSG